MASTVAIVPYQMMAGDEKVVADRLYARAVEAAEDGESAGAASRPAGDRRRPVGRCTSTSSTARSTTHLVLEQDGGKLMGTHQGEFASGDLNGTVAANTVRFQSPLATEGTRVVFPVLGNGRGRQDVGNRRTGRVRRSQVDGGAAPISHRRRGRRGLIIIHKETHHMTTNRRKFLKGGAAVAAATTAAAVPAAAQEKPKKVVLRADGKPAGPPRAGAKTRMSTMSAMATCCSFPASATTRKAISRSTPRACSMRSRRNSRPPAPPWTRS